jgi:acid phosphatase
MENRGAEEILGNPAAPFINSLGRSGLSLTDMHAIAHPSEPNYLALFSGSTQGLGSDACPVTLSGPNLATELRAAGYTFAGYAESLPSVGYTGCGDGEYARKHAPWIDFTNLPASMNQPFTAFPADYAGLPTVSFVVPNLADDMHDGTIGEGDSWLARNVGGYATWARTHDSVLIVTWDENDGSPGNQIATVLVGAGVTGGPAGQPVTHFSLLRSIEDAYSLSLLGSSATSGPDRRVESVLTSAAPGPYRRQVSTR